jgi:FkbM family methyltransferase
LFGLSEDAAHKKIFCNAPKISRLMNFMLRHVHPLWLREKVYFHTPARKHWPNRLQSAELELAPVVLHHLSKSDPMHQQIACLGFYELALSKGIRRLAAKGGILVDVGANIGYFSCLWAATRAENLAYAFEPSPMVFRMLDANIVEAGLSSKVKAFELALGEGKSTLDFHPGPSEQTGWGGIANARSASTIRVEAEKLDAVMPMDMVIDVLKIDTEGADAWVLGGAEGLLRSHRIRHVFFEQNLARMDNLGIPHDAPFRTLESCGYRVSAIGRNDGIFHAWPA